MAQQRYKVLKRNVIEKDGFSICPIRQEDRYKIMQWRNEQLYHLRQKEPLTKEQQDEYFNTVVKALFELDKPDQILFSYHKSDNCIGYGGLVHINWEDLNAEISFIMDTQLEWEFFALHWGVFLQLLEKVAFDDLQFHKIYTYAFDVRPHLFRAIEKKGYHQEATLKEHYQLDGKSKDVKIHAKFSTIPALRHAYFFDSLKAYDWYNSEAVRKYALNKTSVSLGDHQKWFENKLTDNNCEYYILEIGTEPAGSVRFDIEDNGSALVSFLLDPMYFGQGLGSFLLIEGISRLRYYRNDVNIIHGDVHAENFASLKIFKNLGFNTISTADKFSRYQLII